MWQLLDDSQLQAQSHTALQNRVHVKDTARRPERSCSHSPSTRAGSQQSPSHGATGAGCLTRVEGHRPAQGDAAHMTFGESSHKTGAAKAAPKPS